MTTPFRFGDGRDWFFACRFGLFVHWGLYAIPAWHEQHIFRRGMSRADYVPLMTRFKPERFDPDRWIDAAESAGMRYLCFTAKHCDGFCMWDSAETAFKVTNTPYGQDVLRLLADACHRRNVPLCLYYSVPDHHQPNYPHAGRAYEFAGPQPGDEPDEARYVDFLKRQVRELCTRYGKIHGFWWDVNVLKHRDPTVNAMVRALQPGIIINDRGMDDATRSATNGDFGTPERDWDRNRDGTPPARFERPTEVCQSIGSESWGHRTDEDYYSDAHLIGSIQRALAMGGNYLLNVGPTADGVFPPEGEAILSRIGAWFKPARDALVDAAPAGDLTENRDVLLTRRDDILYVHLFREPTSGAVNLPPIQVAPRRATLLHTGEAVAAAVRELPSRFRSPGGCLGLYNLPLNSLRLTGSIIKLEFDRGGADHLRSMATGYAFGHAAHPDVL